MMVLAIANGQSIQCLNRKTIRQMVKLAANWIWLCTVVSNWILRLIIHVICIFPLEFPPNMSFRTFFTPTFRSKPKKNWNLIWKVLEKICVFWLLHRIYFAFKIVKWSKVNNSGVLQIFQGFFVTFWWGVSYDIILSFIFHTFLLDISRVSQDLF